MKLTREGYILYFDEPCKGSEENILLMQAGGLSDPEEKTLMDHIETCEACKALFQHYELIDIAFRDSLTAQQKYPPPKEMPKKLRIQLSEASKRQLATHLQELGQAILFQRPEVCDFIRPWSELKSLNHCVRMLKNSCASILKDPLIQEVGLKSDFVEDCRQFVQGLMDNPSRFMDAVSAKEALDRSLAVEQERVSTVRSFIEYHISKDDRLSAVSEYKRLLGLKLNPDQKYKVLINLGSCLIHVEKYDEAVRYLDIAESFNPSIWLYFTKFKLYYWKHKLNITGNHIGSAAENLKAMDSLIETSDADSKSVPLIVKWFNRKNKNILDLALKNETISRILNKYTGMTIYSDV